MQRLVRLETISGFNFSEEELYGFLIGSIAREDTGLIDLEYNILDLFGSSGVEHLRERALRVILHELAGVGEELYHLFRLHRLYRNGLLAYELHSKPTSDLLILSRFTPPEIT